MIASFQVTDEMVKVALSTYHKSDFNTADQAMRAALVSALAAMWRPISEARDSGPFLLGFPRGCHPLVGHNEDGIWGELTNLSGFAPFATQPTHWMPLLIMKASSNAS